MNYNFLVRYKNMIFTKFYKFSFYILNDLTSKYPGIIINIITGITFIIIVMIIYHCNFYDLNDHHHHLYLIITIYFYYNYLSHDYYYLTASVIRKVPFLEGTIIYSSPLQSVLFIRQKFSSEKHIIIL